MQKLPAGHLVLVVISPAIVQKPLGTFVAEAVVVPVVAATLPAGD
jgi:hypothetical protein